MHRLNLLSLALLLLSPVTLLASYFWNRPSERTPLSQATPDSTRLTPSPDLSPNLSPNSSNAPSLLPHSPDSKRVMTPLNRAYSLPRADYLPPLPNAGGRRPPQSSPRSNIRTTDRARFPQAVPAQRSASISPSIKDPLFIGANPITGAPIEPSRSMSFLDRPTPSDSAGFRPVPITATILPASTSYETAPTVTMLPPSSTMMALSPPPDLSATGSAATASSTLNNPTSAVFAQVDPDPIRQELLIQPLTPSQPPYRQQRVVGAPAATLSTPTGYGASLGQVFMGLSLVNRGRGNNQADGSATIGVGLGDPRRAVGFDVAVNVISLSDSNGQDAFAGSGNVGFKLHRMLPGEIGLAVGWENALAWGDARNVDSSVYGAVSRAFFLQPENVRNPMPLILSLGVGGGRFRSEEAIRRGENTLGFFASAGLQLSPQFSLLANWTGQDLNVGASFIPFPEIPFSLTLGAADLTGSAGDGARLALSLGYGTRFSF